MAFAPQKFDLKNERHRLSTFAHWPVSHIASPKSLAASGFYYVKHEDKVITIIYNKLPATYDHSYFMIFMIDIIFY